MNHPPTYNLLELLRRWVRGETPHEEERQLEQLSEGDPFLAEALEGYRRHPEGRHAERVEKVKSRLRERTKKRRGVLFYLPRVAAAALVLALAGGGFWYLNQKGGDQPALAFEERPDTEEKVEKAASDSAAPAASLPESGPETAAMEPSSEQQIAQHQAEEPPASKPRPAERKTEEKAARPSPPATTEPLRIAQAEPPAAPAKARELPPEADKIADYRFNNKEVAAAEEEGAEDPVLSKARIAAPPAAAKAKTAEPEMRRVSGIVLDENGEPLPGVNVNLEDTYLGTITDLDGRFRLEWPDSIGGDLIFDYTGLVILKVSPAGKDSLEVVIPDGEALLEPVTITGYSSPARARPEKGFSHLRQYIRDNLQYPEEARRNGTEGKVELRFSIQADGTPYNFHIEKGLSEECNREAIRLLKEGPKWEGAGQEATYTVRFKL